MKDLLLYFLSSDTSIMWIKEDRWLDTFTTGMIDCTAVDIPTLA